MYVRIFSSLAIIFLGLLSGYFLKKLWHSQKNSLSLSVERLRKSCQKIALLILIPILFTSTVWIVNFESFKIALLPFMGVFQLFIGGVFALFIANYLQYSWQKKGSFIISGTFVNMGGIGGLVCFMILGEEGFAYVPIYTLFVSLSFFCVGLPLTKMFSSANDNRINIGQSLLRGLKDIYVLVALISIVIGILLNLSGIRRPDFFQQVNAILVPLTNYVILFSIGLGMRFSKIQYYWSECWWISLIRYLLVPASVIALARLTGYHEIANGLLFKAIIILSAMPMANNAVIAASLFDLNLDMANSCYLLTTVELILVIPLLFLITHHIV